eukprot:7501909-Pyramimonas_sp.AAC.2
MYQLTVSRTACLHTASPNGRLGSEGTTRCRLLIQPRDYISSIYLRTIPADEVVREAGNSTSEACVKGAMTGYNRYQGSGEDEMTVRCGN